MNGKHRKTLWLLLLGAVLLFSVPASAKTRRFQVTLTPGANSITVTWPSRSGAATYRIYRADVTSGRERGFPIPSFRHFKKIRTRKAGAATSFTDRKVKSGHYYAYVVKACSRKGKKIASTYAPDYMSCACRGLGTPSLGNNGYGENHLNSRKRLYLYISADDCGIDADGAKVWIFRKTGSGSYKKIATTRMKGFAVEYTDKDVTAGKTYTYRVQLVKRVCGKTVKSKKSNRVTLRAVDFTSRYRVSNLTPAGTYTDRDSLDIEIALSQKGSCCGATRILPGAGEYCGGSSDETAHSYEFRFRRYSLDGKTWRNIPEKGVELPKTGTLYLRGTIQRGEESEICFCGSEKGMISFIFSDYGTIDYAGPGYGPTVCRLDLSEGSGKAYQEWD